MKLDETLQLFYTIYQKDLDAGVPKETLLRQFLQKLNSSGNFYQEMEMSSRFVDSHQDTSHLSDVIDMHSHAFYEILFCKEGSPQYLLGSSRYQLQPGDIIFIPPGVSHSPLFTDQSGRTYHRYVLWLSREFVDRAMQADAGSLPGCSQPILLRTAGTNWSFLEQLFRRACLESETRYSGWRINLGCLALQVLVLLHRALTDTVTIPTLPETPELSDRLLAYIHAHLSEKITLESTAREFLVSESTIRQTFQKQMGISFYRCVTQCRLIRAKSLIQQGDSMEQVSAQVGFADYSAFYRAFRQHFGISPKEYRRLLNKDETTTLREVPGPVPPKRR